MQTPGITIRKTPAKEFPNLRAMLPGRCVRPPAVGQACRSSNGPAFPYLIKPDPTLCREADPGGYKK
jgi:hypothetical protein